MLADDKPAGQEWCMQRHTATRELLCNFLAVACACTDFQVYQTLDVQYYSNVDLDGPGYFRVKYGLGMEWTCFKVDTRWTCMFCIWTLIQFHI
jgi:hypothetical protein